MRREMHADLVLAAGFQDAAHQRVGSSRGAIRSTSKHFELGRRGQTLARLSDAHLDGVTARGIEFERQGDAKAVVGGRAPSDGEIFFVHRTLFVGVDRGGTLGKLHLDAAICFARPGQQEHAARFAIEAMREHEAFAVTGIFEQFDDGALVITRGRMHGDARGFVHGEEVFVLVKNGEGDVGSLFVPRCSPKQDELFGVYAVVAFEASGVDGVGAVRNDFLSARAARSFHLRLHEAIEAHPGGLGRDPEDRHHRALPAAPLADGGGVDGGPGVLTPPHPAPAPVRAWSDRCR